MNELTISEINLFPLKCKDGLASFASCVINNQLYIGNIAIYTSPVSPDGFRLVYPAKTLNNGTKLSIVHPINKETGIIIQKAIIGEYLKLMEKLVKGEDKNEQEPNDT